MPAEHRVIRFGPQEIYKALSMRLTEENKESFPVGELVSLKINESDKDNRIITTIKDESGKEATHEFERKFFALALIFYCGGHNIPLPHGGTKNLMIAAREVAMEIKMGEAA